MPRSSYTSFEHGGSHTSRECVKTKTKPRQIFWNQHRMGLT